MRAQVLTGFDGPSSFQLQDVPEPSIANPDDVRIRIHACGICYRDITYCRGKFGGGRTPSIMGHEGAGEVVEVGSDVHDLQPGDKVVHLQFPFCGDCEMCRAGRPQLCSGSRGTVGEDLDGVFAEQVVLPRRMLAMVPEGIPMPQAAVAACTLGTAYHAIHLHGFRPNGRTIALNGAGGGVGIHAIQIAKALGALVIAATTSETKAEAIKKAGADEVIVAPDGQYRRHIMDLTKRRGVDLFLEIVGAPTLRQSVFAVRKGGRVVIVGNPEGGACEFNPGWLIVRGEIMMYGTQALTMTELEEILNMVATGKVSPVVGTTAPLEDLAKQMERMEARQTTGRVVLTP